MGILFQEIKLLRTAGLVVGQQPCLRDIVKRRIAKHSDPFAPYIPPVLFGVTHTFPEYRTGDRHEDDRLRRYVACGIYVNIKMYRRASNVQVAKRAEEVALDICVGAAGLRSL